MARMSIKRKILLVTTSVSLGIVGIVLFIIIPSVRYIQSIKHDIEFTEAQLEESYQKMKLLKKSFREADAIKQKTEKFHDVTIAQGNELTIIRELEQLAEQHHINQTINVTLEDVINGQPNGKKSSSKRPHYNFSFRNEGSFADHMAYLQAIDHLPYYIIIDAMSWSAASKSNNVNLTFNGIIYTSHD